MADLKIHEKYLDNVEQYTRFGSGGRYDRYAVRYIFNMPEDSEYKDYAFYLDTTDCRFADGQLVKESVGKHYEKKGSYYQISVDDGKKINLFRYKNREESKRYKRYELDATELNSILNYNKAIESLPYAVANVVKYLNNNSRDAGAVVSTEFKLGRTDGTWFYVDNERRKVNSKGIKILGEIEPIDVEKVENIIKNYYVQRRQVELEIEEQKNERYLLDTIMDKADALKSEDAKKQIAEICNNRTKEIIDAGIEICTRLSEMEGRFYDIIHFLAVQHPTEESPVINARKRR